LGNNFVSLVFLKNCLL